MMFHVLLENLVDPLVAKCCSWTPLLSEPASEGGLDFRVKWARLFGPGGGGMWVRRDRRREHPG